MSVPDFVRIPVAVVRCRVMRHRRPDGPDEVAIHDVSFAPDGTVVTRSFEALSPRFPDVESLYGWLSAWRGSDAETMVCGDLGETYDRDDLDDWRVAVELPVLEYEGGITMPVDTSPAAVVQRQLDAYNARDLERFLAEFHEDIEAFRLPATAPALSGKAALGRFYATERFNRPDLHATLVNRMALGNKVIDHERIVGVGDRPLEMAVVYEVIDGLIRRTWAVAE